jgi:ribonuclease VapC
VIAVDTSALVAIFVDEAEGELFSDLIREADEPCVSTATVAETLIVLDNRTRDDNSEFLRNMLFELGLVIEAVTLTDAWIAGDAYRRFGKGRHRARLNFGDCFSYALAKSLDLPLLFKGDDFRHTDIRPAL